MTKPTPSPVNLSGGEKARLLMAITAFHAPHILILDEPTNHLDVDSREALVQALNAYEGAVILISHDRHLIDATVDRLWIVKEGTVRSYDGDMAGYRAELLSERGATRNQRPTAVNGTAKGDARSTRADLRRDAAERRRELAPLRKAMQEAEQRVGMLSGDIVRIDQALGDPDLYARDPAKAQAFAQERGLKGKALSAAENDWLQATEAFETAEAEAGS